MKLQTQPNFPCEQLIARILEAAVNNVDPYRLVDQNILLLNDDLCIGNHHYPKGKFIILVAMGKASLAMTMAVIEKLGGQIKRGICICKTLPEPMPSWPNIEILQGAHPIPDERSLAAGKKIHEIVSDLTADDLVLAIVSGGSSALVVDPCEGIELSDIQSMNRLLLKCGATIDEMNCVRKHLERLKGGGLARLAYPADTAALLLSDVIGDDLSVIASGPTVADGTTFADALNVVHKYELKEWIPQSILNRLEKGANALAQETLKPEDPINSKVSNVLIGSNCHAVEAAVSEATSLGFNCSVVSDRMTGEAELTANWFLDQALEHSHTSQRPAMAVAGGETTVTLHGNGKGGRNLQLALTVVERMSQVKGGVFVTLATDGEDGPTDAAGAIVTDETMKRAQGFGLDPDKYLQNNDAYTFFEKCGGLIKTGSTGTNVNDLTFFFQF